MDKRRNRRDALVKVTIYVEGGGDSKYLHIKCREEFSKLIRKCGFQGRMPEVKAGGSRENTFTMFQTAHSDRGRYAILLVDSEDRVSGADFAPDSSIGWDHLLIRDHWIRPIDTNNNQAQMMTTCMESWIMADHNTLRIFYGSQLHDSSLLPTLELERKFRHDVQRKLKDATVDCSNGYKKGEHSFKLLGSLDPSTLNRHLNHFRRFRQTLDNILEYPMRH